MFGTLRLALCVRVIRANGIQRYLSLSCFMKYHQRTGLPASAIRARRRRRTRP